MQEVEEPMGIKKIIKNNKWVILVFFLAISVLVLIHSIDLNNDAISTGEAIGGSTGILVGKAVGSVEGLTKGREEGFAAGKKEGLSAKDTVSTIKNVVSECQKLEVLVASISIKNFHEIGDKSQYAALYLANGEIIFTVDLSKLEVEEKSDCLEVTVPVPESKFVIDEQSIKKIAEYQTKFFNGKTEDGLNGYLNTMIELHGKVEDNIDNYEELLQDAKNSAKKKIENLVINTSLCEKDINIVFDDQEKE